jgi:hypothetical protein
MKKFDLIHTTILIIGLLAGYSAVSYFIGFLSFLIYYGGDSNLDIGPGHNFAFSFLSIGAFTTCCLVCLNRGRKITAFILKNEPEGASGNPIDPDLRRRSLVFALLLGIGLYSLVQSLPHVLVDAYQLFQNKVARGRYWTPVTEKGTLAIDLLKVTIGAFLIYAAPALSNFIDKKASLRTDGEP